MSQSKKYMKEFNTFPLKLKSSTTPREITTSQPKHKWELNTSALLKEDKSKEDNKDPPFKPSPRLLKELDQELEEAMLPQEVELDTLPTQDTQEMLPTPPPTQDT